MKIKKIIYLFVLLLALIQSCDIGCKKIPLSRNDKSWMSFAEEGDTIIFSSTFQSDSFVVDTKRYIWPDCNRIELGEGQKESGNIRLVKLKRNRYSTSILYELAFNSDFMHDTLSVSSKRMIFFNLRTDLFYSFNELKDSTLFIEPLKKKMRTKFVKSGKNTRDMSDVSIKISEFYWNKEFGVVAYKKENGDMYYYSKKY